MSTVQQIEEIAGLMTTQGHFSESEIVLTPPVEEILDLIRRDAIDSPEQYLADTLVADGGE